MRSIFLKNRNIFYLNILIGVILIFTTLLLVRDIISLSFEKERSPKRNRPSSSVVEIVSPKMQLEDYKSILSNNPFGLFGGEIKSLTASVISNNNSQNQRTDILLLGTVVGTKELSYAIFTDSSGVQELFKVGDPVYQIGVLHRVKKDKVLIKQGAKIIEIPFEDFKIREINKQASNTVFARKIGSSLYVVDQNRLQQMISNPTQMMTDARLKPNIVNGKEEGFILSEVKPWGIYNSLGLQNGDILLRINEYDISNPERALQAFTALKGLDRIQVDLIRNGVKMTMTYQIK
jgi:general secretion pathway protein C